MIQYVVVGLIGAWAMHARAPRAKHRKYTSFGPRTGNVWQVEAFPELGIFTVRAGPNMATFRLVSGRNVLLKYHGDPSVLDHIKKDFLVSEEEPK